MHVPLAGRGVGGAAITITEAGTQAAVTTLPDTQPYPPGPEANVTYHQVPSLFFPAMDAVAPVESEPMISYTVPGPERTLTDDPAVIVGEHEVAEATGDKLGEVALGNAAVEAGDWAVCAAAV